MIVVRVELHSAISHRVTELGRMVIANDGEGTYKKGNYWGKALRGRNKRIEGPELLTTPAIREGEVKNYARQTQHVWNLVAKMLSDMGYK